MEKSSKKFHFTFYTQFSSILMFPVPVLLFFDLELKKEPVLSFLSLSTNTSPIQRAKNQYQEMTGDQ